MSCLALDAFVWACVCAYVNVCIYVCENLCLGRPEFKPISLLLAL